MITLYIPGKPIAQARPRFARRGKFVQTYSTQETEAGKFWLQVKEQLPASWTGPLKGPLKVFFQFYLPVPASKLKTKKARDDMYHGRVCPTGKPDVSNFIKFAEDAINGLVWVDDSQIVELKAWKSYSDTPGTVIQIEEIGV